MKNYLTALFIALLCCSCSNDVEYHYQSIDYFYEPGDMYERTLIPREEIVYTNGTSEAKEIIEYYFSDITDYSTFSGCAETSHKLVMDESIKVPLPVKVNEEGEVITGGWMGHLFKPTVIPCDLSEMMDAFTLPSHTQLSVVYNEIVDEFSLTYEATFQGKDKGDILKVRGKWKGKKTVGRDEFKAVLTDFP